MLYSASTKKPGQLCDMLVGESLDCFKFHKQTVLNEKVGNVIAQDYAIFIANSKRMLL